MLVCCPTLLCFGTCKVLLASRPQDTNRMLPELDPPGAPVQAAFLEHVQGAAPLLPGGGRLRLTQGDDARGQRCAAACRAAE